MILDTHIKEVVAALRVFISSARDVAVDVRHILTVEDLEGTFPYTVISSTNTTTNQTIGIFR